MGICGLKFSGVEALNHFDLLRRQELVVASEALWQNGLQCCFCR